jgi:ParB family chromosome partitioning protein
MLIDMKQGEKMQSTANVAADKAVKAGTEKVTEKLAEKRRALGRGLESLLPGPRMVPGSGAAAREEQGTGAATTVAPPAQPDGSASSDGGAVQGVPGDGGATVSQLHGEAAGRAADGGEIFRLAIDRIDDNPHQTRKQFEQEFLEELANSIRVQGVLQPIVVRPGKDGRFVLILGERRLRASKMAGKTTIPAVIRRVSEQQAAEMTLVENLQREDLHCLEQAQAFANLSAEFQLTQEEIGKRVGTSRETVSNYMRLLKLPADVQTALLRGDLTYSHARVLLALHDESQISRVAQKAIKEKMSVIALDDLVLDINVPVGRPEEHRRGARWVDPNVKAAQRSLETILGMRVRIRDRRGKGKITIEYASLEDFDRVVKMLKGKP